MPKASRPKLASPLQPSARVQWWATLRGWRWPVWIFAITLLALVLRTYRLQAPLADWHSFRQVDTAAVTRGYVKNGIDLLHPRYHDVSNIQSGQLNLEGWRMVEFPLMNAVTAWILRAQPSWPLVPVSRAVSIVSFVLCLVLWGEVVRRWYGQLVAMITMTLMAILPYSLYFTRIVLPEPFLLFWVSLAVYANMVWCEYRSHHPKRLIAWQDSAVLLSAASFAVALLVKPTAIFWLPVVGAPMLRIRVWRWSDWLLLAAPYLASVAPLVWWRSWIQQFPSGIPASDWLFNGNGIRFKPAWWRWLFGDRFGRLWFGSWGAAFIPVGVVAAFPQALPAWSGTAAQRLVGAWNWLRAWLFAEGLVWASVVATLSFLSIFATGNVQHDYYQTPLIPLVCLVWVRGVVWLIRQTRSAVQRTALAGALLVTLIFSTAFAWYEIKGNFQINNPALQLAGEAAQRYTPEDALIIANYNGDTTLLFAADRRGWPIGFSIDEKREQGAAFYLTTAKDDGANELRRWYAVVDEAPEYLLLDLRVPIATPEARSESEGQL